MLAQGFRPRDRPPYAGGRAAQVTGSPYRESARAELVFAGEPLWTLYVWATWAVGVAFVVMLFVVDSVSVIRTALIALVVFVAALLLLWRRAARRVRWRFVLERSSLELERTAHGKLEMVGALDVRDGVQLDIEMASGASELDKSVVLGARGERITWAPGLRAEIAAQRLAAFLRAHDVVVEEPGSG
jgi:hypothetical protein